MIDLQSKDKYKGRLAMPDSIKMFQFLIKQLQGDEEEENDPIPQEQSTAVAIQTQA